MKVISKGVDVDRQMVRMLHTPLTLLHYRTSTPSVADRNIARGRFA
jgi:hypothetical protein